MSVTATTVKREQGRRRWYADGALPLGMSLGVISES